MRKLYLFLLLFVLKGISAQVITDTVASDTVCPQQDFFDLFRKKKPKAPQIPIRNLHAIVLPLIGSTPSTGLQFGAGSTMTWKLGKAPGTKFSAGTVQVLWTTEKQLISYIRSTMFFNRNKTLLQTEWRWYLFRLPAYGLGTSDETYIPELPGQTVVPTGQGMSEWRFPMQYDWLKLHQVLYREVAPFIYAGLGYHFDYYYQIRDELLNVEDPASLLTPHFVYSRLHGFNHNEYQTSGISMNLVYDTRDNIVNAYSGIYVNLNFRLNMKALGSHRNGTTLWTEFRAFKSLGKKLQRHILALWLYGSFKTSGEIPYLHLMSTGFDYMNSSGRGYPEGRWRGEDLVYGELEYRFPISPCTGILGGVVFANVTSASNRDMGIPILGYLMPGAGVGIRIMVGKHDRTNLSVDLGFGEYNRGLYLQAAEVF